MENRNNEIEVVHQKKKRGGRLFFGVVIILMTIFISATSGAFFGFLASNSSSQILNTLKSGKFSDFISNQPDIIRQSIIQEDSAVIDVVRNASPAVVSIVISKDVLIMRNFGRIPNFFSDPFGFFDRNDGNDNGSNEETQRRTIGGGTGFFITTDGMIITNRHVVDDTDADYTVVTSDEKEYAAEVLAVDPVNDIAVIKISGAEFSTLNLGDSSSIQTGQTVVAIGNSLGQFSNTVSRGIISGLQRTLTAGGNSGQIERLTNIIQTDAAINPGNSGGPLLDINGDVIGLNVAIAQGAQSIGFAIPSNQVKRVVDQIKTTGKISTPFIGVRYIPVDDSLQKENNLSFNYGDLVIRGERMTDFAVVPGSPADKAGISENDILLEINGEKIDEESGAGLSNLIAKYNIGEVITLKIWHKGETKDVKIILEERE